MTAYGFYSGLFGSLSATNHKNNMKMRDKCLEHGFETYHCISTYGIGADQVKLINELANAGGATTHPNFYVNLTLAGNTKIESLGMLKTSEAHVNDIWMLHEGAERLTFEQRREKYLEAKNIVGENVRIRTYPLGSIRYVMTLAEERDINPASGHSWEEHVPRVGENDILHFSAFANLNIRATRSMGAVHSKYPGLYQHLNDIAVYMRTQDLSVHFDIRNSDLTDPLKVLRLKQHLSVIENNGLVPIGQCFFRILADTSKDKTAPDDNTWAVLSQLVKEVKQENGDIAIPKEPSPPVV